MQGAAAILAPETAFPTKLWAGCQSITTSSLDPGQFTLAGSVTVWDQLPEEKHSTPGIVPFSCNREIGQLGLGRCIRCMAHPGQCACQAPGCLSCLDLGRAQNAQHTWVWALWRPPSSWYQNQTKTTQKRKLQANITDEHRCKNPEQNSSKQNPTTYLKDHTSWPNGLYPRDARIL